MRPDTPDEALPGGGTRITVKRSCSRCSEPMGDATLAELDAAVAGVQLPDTGDEHGCTPQRVTQEHDERGHPVCPKCGVAIEMWDRIDHRRGATVHQDCSNPR